MVYTELVWGQLQLHMAPAMPVLKYTTSVGIQKTLYKKLVTHVESHVSAVSLLKSGEERYISNHQSIKISDTLKVRYTSKMYRII